MISRKSVQGTERPFPLSRERVGVCDEDGIRLGEGADLPDRLLRRKRIQKAGDPRGSDRGLLLSVNPLENCLHPTSPCLR